MQDLIQETARGIAIPVASYSSAHTNEWVNMENHAKITFTVMAVVPSRVMPLIDPPVRTESLQPDGP